MQKTIWLESYRNTSKIDKVMQKTIKYCTCKWNLSNNLTNKIIFKYL